MWTLVWDFIQHNYEGIIAVCALAISIYEARLARRHNVLTLIPRLELKQSRIEIDDPTTNSKVHFTLDIKNTGMGPAIINDFEVYFKTKLRKKKFSLAKFSEIIEEIKKNHKSLYVEIFHETLCRNLFIPAGEKVNLLTVTCLQYTEESKDELKYVFDRMEAIITYISLYGEEFEVD